MTDVKKDAFIANLLKYHREKAGLTVQTVVSELKKRNISIAEKTIYGYERGTSTPHVKVFMALCDIYHVSDILGSFGYKNEIPFSKDEWTNDQYNDFFHAQHGILEQIYLLFKDGIPSFENYEQSLSRMIPKKDQANFSKFYNLFSELNEAQRGVLFDFLADIKKYDASLPAEIMTKEEKRLIQRYRRISEQHDLDIIENILSRYDKASSVTPATSAESVG